MLGVSPGRARRCTGPTVVRQGKDGKFKLGGLAVEVAKINKGGGPQYVLQLLIK